MSRDQWFSTVGETTIQTPTSRIRRIRFVSVGVVVLVLILTLLVDLQFFAAGSPPDFYVNSATGADSNDGSADHPFLTLTKAQAAVRTAATAGTRVFVSGEFNLGQTFTLDSVDSGSATLPNTWIGQPGATIRGSWKVPNLTLEAGTTYKTTLVGTPAENKSFDSMFYNGTRLLKARYPDNAALDFTKSDPYQGMRIFVATDQVASKNVLKYSSGADEAMISPLAGKTGLAVQLENESGLWTEHTKANISSIDPATRTITLDRSLTYDIKAGNEYWIEGGANLLTPGEFYVDPTTKELKVDLSKTLVTTDRVSIPIVDDLVRAGANYLTWHGFKMEEFNKAGFIVSKAVTNVTFRNNLVQNGKNGFSTEYTHATNLLVDGNEFTNLEGIGVSFYGGFFNKTLTPAGNVASNNHIHHNDLIAGWGQTGGIFFDKEQSGDLAIGNTITDLPGHGMSIEGPRETLKNNYIFHVSLMRHDRGGIQSGGRNALNQGSVIDGNVIRNVASRIQISYGVWKMFDDNSVGENFNGASFGLMLDDFNSGWTVNNNIIESKKGPCVSNHGGGYNHYENNYFSCGNTAIVFGGIRVDDAFFAPIYTQMYNHIQNMAAEGFDAAKYLTAFPNLSQWPAPDVVKNGDIPRDNKVINNITDGYRSYKLQLGDPTRYVFTGNTSKNSCTSAFRALQEPISTPGTFTDLTKAQWQALGLDTDLVELGCTQPLFTTGTYQVNTASPASVSAFQELHPENAGTKTVIAPQASVVAGSTQISTSTIDVTVDPKVTDPYSYQIDSSEFQVRSVSTAGTQTATSDWQALTSNTQSLAFTGAVDGTNYVACVRTKLNALILDGRDPNNVYSPESCTSNVKYSTSSGTAGDGTSSGGTADTTPPTISITSPVSGAKVVGNSFKIATSAKDNVGVFGVDVLLDAVKVGGCTYAPPVATANCSVSVSTRKLANGAHNITAVATDTSSNKTSTPAKSFTYTAGSRKGGTSLFASARAYVINLSGGNLEDTQLSNLEGLIIVTSALLVLFATILVVDIFRLRRRKQTV